MTRPTLARLIIQGARDFGIKNVAAFPVGMTEEEEAAYESGRELAESSEPK